MSSIRHARLATMMLAAATLVPGASAVEPLQTSILAEHCSEYGMRRSTAEDLCIRYVQGFIDGAVATDERVVRNLDREYKESFTERALRTRGRPSRDSDLVSQFGSTYYADFCLGSPVPLKDVVAMVAEHLNDPTKKSVHAHSNARDLVYYVMRTEYPCKLESK